MVQTLNNPNPNKGVFNIEVTSELDASAYVSIRIINGQVIFAKKDVLLIEGTSTILFNISNISPGTYTISVRTEKENITELLIITK